MCNLLSLGSQGVLNIRGKGITLPLPCLCPLFTRYAAQCENIDMPWGNTTIGSPMFRPLKLANSICRIQCLQSIGLKALLDNGLRPLKDIGEVFWVQETASFSVAKPDRIGWNPPSLSSTPTSIIPDLPASKPWNTVMMDGAGQKLDDHETIWNTMGQCGTSERKCGLQSAYAGLEA